MGRILIAVASVTLFSSNASVMAQPRQSVPTPLERLGRLAPMTNEHSGWILSFPQDVQPIFRRWLQFTGECRGGPGDRVPAANIDEWMSRVCAARDAADAELRFHGYCYGRANESGAQHRWHVCRQDSNGFDWLATN